MKNYISYVGDYGSISEKIIDEAGKMFPGAKIKSNEWKIEVFTTDEVFQDNEELQMLNGHLFVCKYEKISIEKNYINTDDWNPAKEFTEMGGQYDIYFCDAGAKYRHYTKVGQTWKADGGWIELSSSEWEEFKRRLKKY